jgi:perosamine synthetase
MSRKIPLFKIYWDEEDVKKVTEAIKAGMNWAIGPNIEKFEKKISEYIGTKYCVTFNSGTSALYASLLVHDIGEGDEVIVPSFTFIATANAPLFVGAKPVFADIEEDTFGIDPEDVKKRITKKTKAIIAVHYGGGPCRIKELKEIAEDQNLILIEDAAEAFGAKIDKRMVGCFGESAIFSFCANKVISTGEGGAITTDSGEVHERLKLIRSHGRLETENYFSSPTQMDYVNLGYNFRMSNITSALGIGQIGKVDQIIKLRRKNAMDMAKKLSVLKGKITLPSQPQDYFHVYQMYTISVVGGRKLRDSILEYLKRNGIMSKVYFTPVHQTHFYKNKLKYDCILPVTEKVSDKVLTLPMYPELKENEIDFISEKIKDFFLEKM